MTRTEFRRIVDEAEKIIVTVKNGRTVCSSLSSSCWIYGFAPLNAKFPALMSESGRIYDQLPWIGSLTKENIPLRLLFLRMWERVVLDSEEYKKW